MGWAGCRCPTRILEDRSARWAETGIPARAFAPSGAGGGGRAARGAIFRSSATLSVANTSPRLACGGTIEAYVTGKNRSFGFVPFIGRSGISHERTSTPANDDLTHLPGLEMPCSARRKAESAAGGISGTSAIDFQGSNNGRFRSTGTANELACAGRIRSSHAQDPNRGGPSARPLPAAREKRCVHQTIDGSIVGDGMCGHIAVIGGIVHSCRHHKSDPRTGAPICVSILVLNGMPRGQDPQ